MKYKLAIFDFDDTIVHLDVDWDAVKWQIIKRVEETGASVSDEVKKMHVMYVTNELSQNGYRDIVIKTCRENEENCIRNNGVTVFPKMIELLKKLKEKGYLVAIASGNTTPTIKDVLSSQDMAPDFMAGRDSVTVTKPYPDVLNIVLKELDVNREDAVFIGNSEEFDAGSGKNAKIKTIVIRPNNGEDITMLHKLLLQ